ncbi:MAG: hypothetical protein ACJ741_03910 [Pyrinomonadaceae bacterium]
MLNRLACALLICAALTIARAQTLPRIDRESDAHPRQLISEGLGVSHIYVGHSTADDVASAYGKTFETVEHGALGSEMRYAALGLSFHYCGGDEQRRIVRVEARPPFEGFTARGITLGASRARDVLKAYGQAEPKASPANDSWFYAYPGVEFHVAHRDLGDKSASQLLGSRIDAIAVVAEDWAGCTTPTTR